MRTTYRFIFATMVMSSTLVATATAYANDNAAMMAFARKNAGRYDSESVAVNGITIGAMLKLRATIDSSDVMELGLSYDQSTEMARISSGQLGSLNLSTVCKPTGSFVGSNAFGVRRTVKRESCERFIVHDKRYRAFQLNRVAIPMPPAQYRSLTQSGATLELDFTIASTKGEAAVSFEEFVDGATIDDPLESHMKAWVIRGDVSEIRMLLPGVKGSPSTSVVILQSR